MSSMPPRKPAIKRIHSVLVEALKAWPAVPQNNYSSIIFDRQDSLNNRRPTDEEGKRRQILMESTFDPIPCIVNVDGSTRDSVMMAMNAALQKSSDASLTFTEDIRNCRKYMDSATVLFDEEKDVWYMIIDDQTHPMKVSYQLKEEAKLRVIETWLKDPILFGQIAERVQEQITALGETGREAFLKNIILAAAPGASVTFSSSPSSSSSAAKSVSPSLLSVSSLSSSDEPETA